MLRSFIRRADGTIQKDVELSAIKSVLVEEGAVMWLDLKAPTPEEIKLLTETFEFHPLAVEDSLKYAQRPKIENYCNPPGNASGGYFYMVFHGPDLETFRQRLRTKELDIFFGKNYLVTLHDEQMRSIDSVLSRFDADARRMLDQGIDLVLYQILDRLTDHYQPILDYLEERIDKLEERALDRPKPEILNSIAIKKRELLLLRRIIGPQREVIAQIARGEVSLIRESSLLYFRDVQDHLIRYVEMVELLRDLILAARDIYLSSISNRMNQIMKTLTIISVIAMPLTVITGFFGMNFDAIPGLHDPRAFWGTVIVMGIAVSIMLYFFKLKNWI